MRGDTVQDGGHPVLANAPMKLPARRGRPEGAALLERRAGAAAEVGGAADQVGRRGRDRLESEAGRLPRRQGSASGRQTRQAAIPPLGQLARHPAPEFRRELGVVAVVRLPPLVPVGLQGGAAIQRAAPVRQRVLGKMERGLRGPTHELLGSQDLVGTERSAVGLGGVALGRRGIGDVGPEDDQRRLLGLGAGGFERRRDTGEVVAVPHAHHVPAVGLEPPLHVLGERERGVTVDGDVVVVVHHGKLAEAEVAGERRRLAGHAFHEVAVAGEGPDPMIHHPVAGAVEVFRQEPLGHRHADRVREALSQRAGRGLDARGVSPLGMPRGA
jgi:hypothetical protein